MKIMVAIATAGRADVLAETLEDILAVRGRFGDVLVCPARSEDMPPDVPAGVRAVAGSRGSSAQRNALIEVALAEGADAIAFFDDDYVPERDHLEAVARALADDAVAVVTGTVLADGVVGPGLTIAAARAIVAAAAPPSREVLDLYNGYGCNMTVRLRPVRDHALRFDERLPLYAWLEDVDFSRQLAPYGRIVRIGDARGVHMGTKRGRTPGLRLGYSQVANPIYLWRKGAITARKMSAQVSRNVVSNLAKAFRPEPWVDRRGRVAGNFRGFRDLLLGRLDPTAILDASMSADTFGK